MRLKGSTNLESIQIVKKTGGQMKDSYLDEGFILDKKIGVRQSKRIENARILLANTPMDTDKIKIYGMFASTISTISPSFHSGARVRVDSMDKVAEIEKSEKAKMKTKVNKILAHDINVFINRQLIYNYPEHLLGDAGVSTIEHADFEGIERLVSFFPTLDTCLTRVLVQALVLDGDIVSTFDDPKNVRLGRCDLVEEVMIGESKVLRFSGVPKGEACTIVLRGASQHLLDEAERSLHDALCVLSQTV